MNVETILEVGLGGGLAVYVAWTALPILVGTVKATTSLLSDQVDYVLTHNFHKQTAQPLVAVGSLGSVDSIEISPGVHIRPDLLVRPKHPAYREADGPQDPEQYLPVIPLASDGVWQQVEAAIKSLPEWPWRQA